MSMIETPSTPTPAGPSGTKSHILIGQPETVKKRKHDEIIKSLDQAMGPSPEDASDFRPPKRQNTARSIYSTLAKYGITSKDSNTAKPTTKTDGLSKAPHLSKILARTAEKTRKAIPFKFSLSGSSSSISTSSSSKDFSPSSPQAFLERLSTFKPSTYTSKPEAIDSAAAARCGWTNDGKDRLVCTMCASSWVVAGRDGMSRDAAHALVEKQRGQLVSQHKNLCPWKTRQCDPSIYTVQITAPAVMARELKGRSNALESFLKDVSIQHPLTPSHIAAVRSVLKRITLQAPPLPPFPLPPAETVSPTNPDISVTMDEEPLPEPSETAIIVGLFGWSPAPPTAPERSRTASVGRVTPSLSRSSSMAPSLPGSRASTPGPSTPVRRPSFAPSTLSVTSLLSGTASAKKAANTMLHCTLCQRRVGMWTFVPQAPAADISMEATPTSATPPRPKRPLPTRAFDVLKEHRPYCPYVVCTTTLPSLPAAPGVPAELRSSAVVSEKVEGWRAVVSSICRYGLGQQQRSSSRSGGARESTSELARVEAMVDQVKSRGGKDLFSYVKELLG